MWFIEELFCLILLDEVLFIFCTGGYTSIGTNLLHMLCMIHFMFSFKINVKLFKYAVMV